MHHHTELDSIKTKLGGEGHSGSLPEQTKYLTEVTRAANTYCEIGFNVGHSAATVLSHNPSVNVISFDIGGKNSKEAYTLLRSHYGDRLKVHWGDSTRILPSVEEGLQCDVFFVDGGHSAKVARADLTNIKRHLKPNGLVIMDDVYCRAAYCPGPTAAWHADIASGIINETYRWSDENKRGFAAGTFSQ